MAKLQIKTLDIQVKEWFDKVNGNSYFAGRITVNYGLKGQTVLIIPFQYGYGDHYRHEAFKVLIGAGLLPAIPENVSHWQYYQEKGIIARHSKQENCRKKDVLAFIAE